MKIDQSIEFFNQLTEETQNSSERRRYRQFARMLNELKEKDTSGKHTMIIDRKLDEIQPQLLSAADRKKAMQSFKKFLMKSLRYVPANYYVTLGTGLGNLMGSALGVTFGITFYRIMGIVFGILIGGGFGLTLGLLFGRYLDKKARTEKRVLEHLWI